MTHLGTTSSKEQFFHSVLQPACKQVADDEDAWTEATFGPLLTNEPSSAALALAEHCISVLHRAYAEGLKFPASEDGTARATFVARSECSEQVVALFPYFQRLYTAPLPEGLEVAWADLWLHVCGLFIVENGKPTVTVTAASEDTEQPPTERDERSAHPHTVPPSCSPCCGPSFARHRSRSFACFPVCAGVVLATRQGGPLTR